MTDKMRQDFETWAKRKWNGISLLRVNQPGTPRDGQYEAQAAKDCWEAWVASRSAIEIELPEERWGDRFADGFNDMYSKAYDLIEAAGLRVKS